MVEERNLLAEEELGEEEELQVQDVYESDDETDDWEEADTLQVVNVKEESENDWLEEATDGLVVSLGSTDGVDID